MAVGFVASGSGSVAGGASSSGTLSFNITGWTPAAGHTLLVSVYSSDPGGMKPNGTSALTCNNVSLYLLDYGVYSTNSVLRVPALWGAPYTSGMTNTINVNWKNTANATRNIYAIAVVLTGISTSYSGSWNGFRTNASFAGVVDGASNNYDPYLNAGTNTNGSGNASGSILTLANSAGIPTTYDSQNEPFIICSWQANQGGLAPSTFNGSTTITNGAITTSGQSSGTTVVAASSNYTITGGTAYVNSPNGIIPFTYASVVGSTLTGCQIYGGSASPFYNYATNLNGSYALINNPIPLTTSSISGTPVYNGFKFYDSYTGATNLATAGVSGVQSAGTFSVNWGNSLGLTSTPAYILARTTSIGALMYTFVPTTRKITRNFLSLNTFAEATARSLTKTRNALSLAVSAAQVIKKTLRNKSASSLSVDAARSVKTSKFTRTATSLLVRSAFVSKTLQHARNAIATLVGSAYVSKTKAFSKAVKSAIINIAASGKGPVKRIRYAKSVFTGAAKEGKVVFYAVINVALSVLPDEVFKTVSYTRRAFGTAVKASNFARTKIVKRYSKPLQIRSANFSKRYISNRYARAVAINSSKIIRKTLKGFFVLALSPVFVGRRVYRKRYVNALSPVSATVTRRVTSVRGVSVTATWPVNAKRTQRLIRKAGALIAAASKFFFTAKITGHPGQVGGAVYTAILGANIEEPSVSAQVSSAIVGSEIDYPSVSANVSAPIVGAEVIFSE